MNLLSWNCRGFGNPRTVHELHLLVKEKIPNVVFLMETKFRREKVEWIRNKIKFDCTFVVDCIGRSGGIAIL